jgi:hypothetical protein
MLLLPEFLHLHHLSWNIQFPREFAVHRMICPSIWVALHPNIIMKAAGTESHALAVNYIILIILLVVLYLLWLSLWLKETQGSCQVRGSVYTSLRFVFGSWGRGQLVSLLICVLCLLVRWRRCQSGSLNNDALLRLYVIWNWVRFGMLVESNQAEKIRDV